MIPLTLNWFGMAVHDVQAAADFYSKKLAFSCSAEQEGWRYFNTRRMVFELFKAYPERLAVKAWGNGQAFRPVMLVHDLEAMVALLHKHEIPYTRLEPTEFGAQIEFSGPEGIRWSLKQVSAVAEGWADPIIAGIELKAVNLAAQKDFYIRILGMSPAHETGHEILLTQPSGESWLRVEAGGSATSLPASMGRPKLAFFHPIWISYETPDVMRANEWLRGQNATILCPLTTHTDWDGTDLILEDADGNLIQVVQYGKVDGA